MKRLGRSVSLFLNRRTVRVFLTSYRTNREKRERSMRASIRVCLTSSFAQIVERRFILPQLKHDMFVPSSGTVKRCQKGAKWRVCSLKSEFDVLPTTMDVNIGTI